MRRKLELTNLPDELDDAGWDYGVPLADLKRLLEHWKNGYDWRKFEAEVNKLPMFTRNIAVDGFGTLDIHYVHQKSEREGAIPLFFSHGCKRSPFSSVSAAYTDERVGPGHFLEARKLLPLLTAPSSPDDPAFHVVAVSLPGYPGSEAPKQERFRRRPVCRGERRVVLTSSN